MGGANEIRLCYVKRIWRIGRAYISALSCKNQAILLSISHLCVLIVCHNFNRKVVHLTMKSIISTSFWPQKTEHHLPSIRLNMYHFVQWGITIFPLFHMFFSFWVKVINPSKLVMQRVSIFLTHGQNFTEQLKSMRSPLHWHLLYM